MQGTWLAGCDSDDFKLHGTEEKTNCLKHAAVLPIRGGLSLMI